tara:strand:- start:23 stop:559 length:537 start_codon:yes stop_codon:yes gene_type:complete
MNQLYKNQNLYNDIYKVSIEDPQVKIPKTVTSVPTIIIKDNQNFITYVGDEVFEWFKAISNQNFNTSYDNVNKNIEPSNNVKQNFKPKQKESNNGIQCYDPIGMSGGFSDSFSSLSDASPLGHCYEFLGGIESNKINMAQNSLDENKSDKESQLNSEYERLIENRRSDSNIPQQINRK